MKSADVHLPKGVLGEMEREAERAAPNETGGVLLGYRDREEPELIQVMHLVGPGPSAVHEPCRFEPDSRWQEEQIAEVYAESGRVATYLGDWHSHPAGSAVPSKLDRSTARRIARCREARVRHPLILIIWGGPGDWGVAAHLGGVWRLRPAKTTLVCGDAAAGALASH